MVTCTCHDCTTTGRTEPEGHCAHLAVRHTGRDVICGYCGTRVP